MRPPLACEQDLHAPSILEACMHNNFSDDPNDLKEFLKSVDNEYDRYSEVLALMQNCSLCGSHLDFVYTMEYPGEVIREEASCPHCEIRIRNKLFNIQ